jgi:hypothetical protein
MKQENLLQETLKRIKGGIIMGTLNQKISDMLIEGKDYEILF